VEAVPEPVAFEVDDEAAQDEPTPRPATEAVDTHCHLFLMEEDPAEIVDRANAAGVGRLVCVGIDHHSSRRSLELAEAFRGVFATAGMHPHTASEFDREAGAAIEELLSDPMVVAVGETGLDYYRKLSPAEDQQRVFRSHIALSRETDKPLVVHVREAWEDAMAILDEEGATRVILHCFSGDQAVADEAVRRGYFLSFAGNITYPGAEGLLGVAAGVPGGHALAETDSPFLSPQHIRGRPNTPTSVLSVIDALAKARGGIEPQELIAETTVAALEAIPLLL
jgi:TatD DNase family protein